MKLTKQGVRDLGGAARSSIRVPYWFTCVVLLACRGARVEIHWSTNEQP